MIEQIKNCRKCGLCKNQRPLMDKTRECQVIWVGLSAKKMASNEDSPLSPDTNTGMIIKKVEQLCGNVTTYKTNLVKCLPLSEEKKLRYPNKKEIDSCFDNLMSEIDSMQPRIVFLLGEKVYSSVEKHLNLQFKKWTDFNYTYTKYDETYYIPIQHPSYVYVYRRRYIDEYVRGIERVIKELL